MSSDIGPWHGGDGGGGGGGWTGPLFTTPFSSDPWDSWDYGGGGSGGGGNENAAALAHANVDWRETDRAHIFRVELPGVRKEDLKVEVEDESILHMSGERSVEKVAGEDDKWHRVERRRGSFTRRFRLPENADVEGIKCGLEEGVLTVEVPKKEGVEAVAELHWWQGVHWIPRNF